MTNLKDVVFCVVKTKSKIEIVNCRRSTAIAVAQQYPATQIFERGTLHGQTSFVTYASSLGGLERLQAEDLVESYKAQEEEKERKKLYMLAWQQRNQQPKGLSLFSMENK